MSVFIVTLFISAVHVGAPFIHITDCLGQTCNGAHQYCLIETQVSGTKHGRCVPHHACDNHQERPWCMPGHTHNEPGVCCCVTQACVYMNEHHGNVQPNIHNTNVHHTSVPNTVNHISQSSNLSCISQYCHGSKPFTENAFSVTASSPMPLERNHPPFKMSQKCNQGSCGGDHGLPMCNSTHVLHPNGAGCCCTTKECVNAVTELRDRNLHCPDCHDVTANCHRMFTPCSLTQACMIRKINGIVSTSCEDYSRCMTHLNADRHNAHSLTLCSLDNSLTEMEILYLTGKLHATNAHNPITMAPTTPARSTTAVHKLTTTEPTTSTKTTTVVQKPVTTAQTTKTTTDVHHPTSTTQTTTTEATTAVHQTTTTAPTTPVVHKPITAAPTTSTTTSVTQPTSTLPTASNFGIKCPICTDGFRGHCQGEHVCGFGEVCMFQVTNGTMRTQCSNAGVCSTEKLLGGDAVCCTDSDCAQNTFMNLHQARISCPSCSLAPDGRTCINTMTTCSKIDQGCSILQNGAGFTAGCVDDYKKCHTEQYNNNPLCHLTPIPFNMEKTLECKFCCHDNTDTCVLTALGIKDPAESTTTTIRTSTTQKPTIPPCVDHDPNGNCAKLSANLCTSTDEAVHLFAISNCAKTCNFCSHIIPG